jgi:hypothetical protein
MQTKKDAARMNKALEEIATKHLDLETLATRRSDSLDFHEHAVWAIRSALEAAYQAGSEVGRQCPVSPGSRSSSARVK